MKRIIAYSLILCGFFSSGTVLANDNGYATPEEAIQAFLNPLKKGRDGISESMRSTGSLNGESESSSSVATTLRSDMKEQGKVVKFKQTDSSSRLNGNMQKFTYQIEYSTGKKRDLSFTVLRPMAGGGYFIMRTSIDN